MESAFRRQKAVLWVAVGVNDHGEATYSTPIQITVRWNNKQSQVNGPQNVPVMVDALAVVDREIPTGSLMWKGPITEWYGTGSGPGETSIMEVVAYNETPDIKGRSLRRTVGLTFFRGTLPDLT